MAANVPESDEVIQERMIRLLQRYYRTCKERDAMLDEVVLKATRAMKAFAAAFQGFRLPPGI